MHFYYLDGHTLATKTLYIIMIIVVLLSRRRARREAKSTYTDS